MATKYANSRTFGYRRVSSVHQSYERQTAALYNAGIDEGDIFEDKLSGSTMNRQGLDALRRVARPGDEIVVSSLDRLGRTVLGTLRTIEELETQGVYVRSLKPGESFEGPTGVLMRQIMLAIAEWERENTRERAADARAARTALGTHKARGKSVLTAGKIDLVRKLRATGIGATLIASEVGISRASVYRALRA
ncbi:recombinase family protein [Herbiconiux sp. SYSU D00978]|uniref:recombinase family protein n=1 Tax=Herbiconiux sp. SYSU D00978 TaxID=2812562 RepID=UPI001A96BB57|nr:recombinase family protein [Herbiconiux sp. SYSU D00978]